MTGETSVAADPVRDPARLAAVFASHLLDTPPEAAFDDLTRMAALLVGAPFAFATIVDEARSFWKSSFGLPEGAPHQNTVEESFCQYVVRSERELVIADARTDPRTSANPSIESMGVRAWAGFPLLAPDGEVLGSFCIVDTAPRNWTARDVEIIRTLASAAAREIALRGAVASERDARQRAEALAHTLQQSLLPPALPEVAGLDIEARFHPAGGGLELVGDFYDLFASGNDTWSFVVGDVCGKGIEAAKVAALARHTIGALAMQHFDTARVLALLNETLIARSPAPGTFLTAVYGTLTQRRDGFAVRLAVGGHPPPILRRADGTAAFLETSGLLVGVEHQYFTTELRLHLAAGDALIVYTDGVDEARNGSALFGHDALLALVASMDPNTAAAGIARGIEEAVLAFGRGVARDDIAILVIRVP
ncbi:MAG: PP2C family protein-serine/threonine phosphatase [Candidatus Velthaea sp.]